jgi:photoactive yellow protein
LTLVDTWGPARELDFDDADLRVRLDALSPAELDEVPFGVIAFNADNRVVGYNQYEADRAGISAERVLRRDLFVDVAPCTNNYLVAQRYLDEPHLDEQLDYVFTFKMAPTPVRLRLLGEAGASRRYLVVRPR